MVHRHQRIVHPWSKMTWTKSAEMKQYLKERIRMSVPRLANNNPMFIIILFSDIVKFTL
jgi:hypothetical protein